MYSDKKNVLQLTALLKSYNINHIVCSPGARNAPLVHSFVNDPFFTCHSVVDERSAGFFAIGIIQQTKGPVAVCCTSGTAVMNLGPAVAEAYYQELPLLVISADRPAAWIGQMDGQTLPQPDIFRSLVRKAVNLPEIHTEEDEWYCNRLINEAILSLGQHGCGPAHINIPISEPLFEFRTRQLPQVRKISYRTYSFGVEEELDRGNYADRFAKFDKVMIVLGQTFQDEEMDEIMNMIVEEQSVVVISEHTSNLNVDSDFYNFDTMLAAIKSSKWDKYTPDLLITLGGHITSKRLKKMFRTYPPKEHWVLSSTGLITDTFQCMTELLEMDPVGIIDYLIGTPRNGRSKKEDYFGLWQKTITGMRYPEIPFSDLYVVKEFMKALPQNSTLQLANSSSVRHAQMFPRNMGVSVFSNRGVNGIEGCVSTAVGYAAVTTQPVFLLTGDLSFFYDMNGIWNSAPKKNLHILINNNRGGGLLHTLKDADQSSALNDYIAAGHHTSAEGWAKSAGFDYIAARNENELKTGFPDFVDTERERPVIMEVFTSGEKDAEILRSFYNSIKI